MDTASPQMEEGVFYDLNPPIIVVRRMPPYERRIFPKVQCEYQVPNHPDEYVVKGIPTGGTKEESFVLRFTKHGKVRTVRSQNQSSIRLHTAT